MTAKILDFKHSPPVVKREENIPARVPLKEGWYLTYTKIDRDTDEYSPIIHKLDVEGSENCRPAFEEALKIIAEIQQGFDVEYPRVKWEATLWV